MCIPISDLKINKMIDLSINNWTDWFPSFSQRVENLHCSIEDERKKKTAWSTYTCSTVKVFFCQRIKSIIVLVEHFQRRRRTFFSNDPQRRKRTVSKEWNKWMKDEHLFLSFVLFIRRFDRWSSISIHKLRREMNVKIVHRELSITYVLLVILFYHLVICLIWLCQYWTMMRDICNEHRDHLFSHRFVIRHRNRNEKKKEKGNTKILLNVYVSVDQWRERDDR